MLGNLLHDFVYVRSGARFYAVGTRLVLHCLHGSLLICLFALLRPAGCVSASSSCGSAIGDETSVQPSTDVYSAIRVPLKSSFIIN
ncbi:protein of unknown function [Methylocaldum szegediense]|uniref:Secreted protein n=1 Tax=Methylocaldum szegediense TaxID=73780 RepID=A0ABN8X9P9_9GAMM|nr:protein of unknown function [Methylocaldum szegediense]